jgi:hypothetical protein
MKKILTLFCVFIGSISSLSSMPIDSSMVEIQCTIKEHHHHHHNHSQMNQREDRHSYPHVHVREGTSLNWSGYAALTNLNNPAKNSVTQVSGSWVVPTLSSTPNTAYSSIWVGIEGYSDNTVEQIGTEHDWVHGVQQNYAWFEMYPNYAYEIVGFPVNKGDLIGAEVSYVGNNTFSLQLINYTHNVHTTIPTSYTKSSKAQRSSAEWIVEAPSSYSVLPLADFNTAAFTNCSATINGVTGSINNSHWKFDGLTMETSHNIVKALQSSLSGNGEAFTVTWEHE